MHDLGIANTRNTDEFDQMNRMFAELYPDVPVPKSVWHWIDAAQHRLAGAGAARALSVVDLLVCGTAAITGLAILHDDADYELAARHLTDIQTRRVVPFTD
jgi:predicted nucleic acid-binding protein